MNPKHTQLLAELEEVRAANPDGYLVPDEAIEYARTHPDSGLHASLNWDDMQAGIYYRRRQMGQIIRAVFTVERSHAQPVHAYWSPPSHRADHVGYVTFNAVRSDTDIALEIARDMLLRVKAAHEDLQVVVEAVPRLRTAARTLSRAVAALEQVISEVEAERGASSRPGAPLPLAPTPP